MRDSTPIISVQNLSISFKIGKNEIFDAVKNISFDVRQGETLALVGESGSGKSISALSILKLLGAAAFYDPKSRIIFQGKTDLLAADEPSLREIRGRKIAMIFQEPMTSLNPLHTIERQITESLKIHTQLNKDEREKRVIELLNLVGLEQLVDRLNAYPHELSGGQRQRVMIAMALACEPDVLIADEPTTALDVTIQAQILNLLKDIQKSIGMAILLITHDLTIVKNFSHRIAVIRQGEIVEQGRTQDVFGSPQHDYTKMLMNAQPKGEVKNLDKNAEIILQADNVTVAYPKSKNFFGKVTSYVKALNNISLNLHQGETLGIVGESGSGKSTLGFSLVRLLNPQGKIVFMGRDIAKLKENDIRPLRSKMQIVFQDPFGSLSPRMSVADIIAEGLSIHFKELSHQQRDEMVIEAMQKVRLDPATRHRFPHEFSGGQRQRVAIARALILKPTFIVMDEPTSALDMSVQADVVDLLRELQENIGVSYVFISHDLRVIKALSHHVIVMKNGDIVEQGQVYEIFNAPKTDYTKKLVAAAFEVKVA